MAWRPLRARGAPHRSNRRYRMTQRAKPVRRAAWLTLLAAVVMARAQAGGDVRNWYDDPFFQVSAALPDCPPPAGPFVTETEMRVQSHHRAEKGTSCWLAGECDRPTAYAYDRDIASAFQAALHAGKAFPRSSLWVTVQGRVVYIEGCASEDSTGIEAEAFARSLPSVQQATAIVRIGPELPPPYRVAPAQ